jgi:NAD(P)-dependent dehydrogenase (short-subunit alcohol dehydrogenase family)
MFKLTDKIALVTGAGSGIGAAIAETFAQAEAHVFVTDLNEDAGRAVVRKITSAGVEDGWATHWVTVGAVQEKVGVSVDRSQTDSQDCGLAKRLVGAISG